MARVVRKLKNEALESLDVKYVLDVEGATYKENWGHSGKQINLKTCPFCGNTKWKVYLNANTGLGKCFAGSCTQGTFNKWQLMAAIYGLSGSALKAKIDILAINQGWRPIEPTHSDFVLPDLNLPNSIPCHELPAMPRYLLDRKITAEIAYHFGLRLCESGTFEVETPDGETIKQDYTDRIIIPIFDTKGDLVSFQGRDITGTSEKRYLFPPMYASTGSQIYNIHNWQNGMDTIVIGEGPFDAIGIKRALHYGLRTNCLAAASFGMSFSISKMSDDQINRLLELKNRGLRHVCLLWDNEPKASKAAIETALKIARYGFRVKVAILKESKDPGEASETEILEALDSAYSVESELQAMLLKNKLSL